MIFECGMPKGFFEPAERRRGIAEAGTQLAAEVQHAKLVPGAVEVRFRVGRIVGLQCLRQPLLFDLSVTLLARAPRQPMEDCRKTRRWCLPHPVDGQRKLQPLLAQSRGAIGVEIGPLTTPPGGYAVHHLGHLHPLDIREFAKVGR